VIAAAACPMGNVCVGSRFSKNGGFFGNFSLWPSRSRNSGGTPSNPTTTSRSVPVVQVQPSESDAKPQPAQTTEAPAPIVSSEPAPLPQPQPTPSEPDPSPPAPASQQQPAQPPPQQQAPPRQQSRKKAAHIKRISSAGLQVESVLRRKTDNLKDKYSLGRKLGQGQFGTTYLCVDKATGLEYACKSIAKRKLVTDEDVEDVRREIQIMHHLAGHPNIIAIRGAFEDAVAVHVVMELCAGGELFDRIVRRGHYTERQAGELARVIVAVVESCHSLGVMHRDLKPENFLFVGNDEESPLKTIDFGLSMFFRPGTVRPSTFVSQSAPYHSYHGLMHACRRGVHGRCREPVLRGAGGAEEALRAGGRRVERRRDHLHPTLRRAAVLGGDGAGHLRAGAARLAGLRVRPLAERVGERQGPASEGARQGPQEAPHRAPSPL